MNKKTIAGLSAFILIEIIVFSSILYYDVANKNMIQYKPFEVNQYIELHMEILHRDSTGKLISRSYHPMTIVNLGLNYTRDFAPYSLDYIGVSNDSSAVSVLWTVIPNEISDGGLARAQGAYLATGNGTWNISKTFSVTATRSSKLYGLYRNATTNTLVAAEQQGVGSQKNMNNGDTLAVTVMATIS